jgi:hypothetical protein
MTEAEKTRVQLERVRQRFSCWRSEHGGRGRSIPEPLWQAAVEVAQLAGLDATARALGLDRTRLGDRLSRSVADSAARHKRTAKPTAAFVEVDAGGVFSRGTVVVRIRERGGEQLEVTLEGGAVEAAAFARAFWEGSRCSN